MTRAREGGKMIGECVREHAIDWMRCQNHSQSSHQFSCHSQKHTDVNNTNLSSLRIIFNEKHAEKQYLEKVTAAHRRRDDDDNDDDDVNSNDKKVFCNIIQCQSNIYNNNQHRFYTGDTPVIRAIFIPPLLEVARIFYGTEDLLLAPQIWVQFSQRKTYSPL